MLTEEDKQEIKQLIDERILMYLKALRFGDDELLISEDDLSDGQPVQDAS